MSATQNSSNAPAWLFMWAKGIMKQGNYSLYVQVPGAGLLVPLLELLAGSAGEEAGFFEERKPQECAWVQT